MARKLQEQELHELFQKNLSQVSVPPALAIRLRQQVLAEVNRTFQTEFDEAVDSTRPADIEQVGFPTAAVSAESVTESPRQSWMKSLGDWFSSLRPATSMFVAAATVAALVVFVILIPRLLPGILNLGPETGASLEPLPALTPIEPAAMSLSAQVLIGDSAAQIVRGQSGLAEIVPANSETVLAPGDSLTTDDGTAEIRYSADKTTLVEAGSQVRLEVLAEADGGTQVVLWIGSGKTRHLVTQETPTVGQFELRTPLMRVAATQADFSVDVQPNGADLLTTLNGQVNVTRTQDGETAQVGADEQLAVTANDALIVQSLDAVASIALAPSPTDPEPTLDAGFEDVIVASPTPAAPSLTANATSPSVAMAADATENRNPATATPSPQMRQTSTVAPATARTTSVRTTPVRTTPVSITPVSTTSTTAPRPTLLVADERDASPAPTATSLQLALVPSPTHTSTPRSMATATLPLVLTSTRSSSSQATTASAGLPPWTVTPTKTSTPTKTDTPRPTAAPTNTRRPTSTRAATATARPTSPATNTATNTPKPMATATPVPTSTLPVPRVIVNQPPVLLDDTRSVREDGSVDVPVLANDSDPNGANLSITGIGRAQHGVATINGAGTAIIYVPDPNFAGTDEFSYEASDGELTSNAMVTISVIPVNDAPSFGLSGATLTIDEDAGRQTRAGWVTDISAGATDEASQTLRFALAIENEWLFAEPPAIDPISGDLTFAAAVNAYGLADVSIVLLDSGGANNGGSDRSAPQTFSIEIRPVDDAPSFGLSESQVFGVEDEGMRVVPNLATAISPGASNEAGQGLFFEVGVDKPALFVLPPAIDAANGELTFAAASDAFGTALLSIVLVDDGGKRSPVQTLSLVVEAVNDAPDFHLERTEVRVNEDSGSQLWPNWATEISAGAENESGQALTFELKTDGDQLFDVSPSIDAVSGDLTFSAAPNAYGRVTVTASLVDEGGLRSPAQTFDIVIDAVNDGPAAEDDRFETDQNTSIEGNVLSANQGNPDTDLDGDVLTVTALNGEPFLGAATIELPSGALLTLQADGQFRYDPNDRFDWLPAGASQEDRFAYTVGDGSNERFDEATVTIVIIGRNDPPEAADDEFTLGAGGLLTANVIAGGSGGTADRDPDGDKLAVIAVNGLMISASETITLPSGARTTMRPDGSFTYEWAAADADLVRDEFVYTVDDGNGSPAEAKVGIRLTP